MSNISVIGAGGWGLALANIFSEKHNIKVENEYYIVKYANCADWYNVIILLMKDNWLLAISYKIFL